MVVKKEAVKINTETVTETKTKISFPGKIVRINSTSQGERMHIEIPAVLRKEIGDRWYYQNRDVKVTLEDF